MFLKLSDAAAYCGYSETQFKRLSEKHHIPKFGPMKNRFKVEDLITFMEDDKAFSPTKATSRRHSGGFTPVVV